MRPAEVRDVEALDPNRQRVETELALKAVQRLHALLAPALGLELLLVERQAALRSARSRMRRLPPRSAARTSTLRPARSDSSTPSTSSSEPSATSACTAISGGIPSVLV